MQAHVCGPEECIGRETMGSEQFYVASRTAQYFKGLFWSARFSRWGAQLFCRIGMNGFPKSDAELVFPKLRCAPQYPLLVKPRHATPELVHLYTVLNRLNKAHWANAKTLHPLSTPRQRVECPAIPLLFSFSRVAKEVTPSRSRASSGAITCAGRSCPGNSSILGWLMTPESSFLENTRHTGRSDSQQTSAGR